MCIYKKNERQKSTSLATRKKCFLPSEKRNTSQKLT